jgi:hypothetical protein
MRHGIRTAVVAVGTCTLLSGCFGSSSPEPTSAQPSSHHPAQSDSPSDTPSSTPTSPATTEPTTSPTSESTSVTAPRLAFDPKSDGRHSHTCLAITGTDPVDYVYYPVMVEAASPVTLDSLSVTYADGVQVAGSWVAPAASTGGTGIVEGWPPPAILVQGSSVQWKKRIPAAGAALDPATGWYTVFLHLRVYPDALPLHTDGVVVTYHDNAGDETATWVDHLSFKASC